MTPRLLPGSVALLGTLMIMACSSPNTDIEQRVARYATVRLTTDLSQLTANQREMLPLLIDAAQHMDAAFRDQAYGATDSLLGTMRHPDLRRYVEINYGPWDRLADNQPFVPGVGPKAAGANFYPADMTKEEFTAAAADPQRGATLRSLYTLVRRDSTGQLVTVPYHEAFRTHVEAAAAKLRAAAALADDPGFKRYLTLRATALETDDYRPSDLAWMDMKRNHLELVIGPIETYEDQLFGYKAAYEAFVLVKDLAWSERLARFAQYLPALQRGLPVPNKYKQEVPGSDADLNAYDAVYYAGDANAGAKTIAINLPNDEYVQLHKGTRRLQLKNAMRAKFDRILVPIADVLIAPDQRQYITFDAFFQNTMFHEVAHGLGIKNTLTGVGTVREALKEHASAMEEGKADILGLYMVTQLRDRGVLPEGRIEDNYVTFLASIFRSVRFGAADAHGRANMVRFNFFADRGAFSRDDASGTYRVDFAKMQSAMEELSRTILTLQGDGDYDGVARLLREQGVIQPSLQRDLDRLQTLGIPVDIVFEQGAALLAP